MTDKKILTITDKNNISYEFEESKDMVYIRKSERIQTISHEEEALSEVAQPKAMTHYMVSHSLNVDKQIRKVSKALLILGIIFLILGVAANVFANYIPMYTSILRYSGIGLIVLGILFIILYLSKKKNKKYDVVSESHNTIFTITMNGTSVQFVESFFDPDKELYHKITNFIYNGEDTTVFQNVGTQEESPVLPEEEFRYGD